MIEQTNGGAATGAPSGDGLTDAEKLTALGAYIKTLKTIEEGLRASVVRDFGQRRVEKVGAYLPDGEKLGAVAYRAGNKSATVTDTAAALRWALDKYPGAVVQAVSPAFLKSLTDHAARVGEPGDHGVDPETGEALDFITVRQGAPYVSITTTKEGVERMTQLAHGFAGMLTASAPGQEPQTGATTGERPEQLLRIAKVTVTDEYDPDFADRLMGGAYDRGGR